MSEKIDIRVSINDKASEPMKQVAIQCFLAEWATRAASAVQEALASASPPQNFVHAHIISNKAIEQFLKERTEFIEKLGGERYEKDIPKDYLLEFFKKCFEQE